MFTSSKRKAVEKSAFSDFIRNASVDDKKRVYDDVLKKASDRQNAIRSGKAATPVSR